MYRAAHVSVVEVEVSRWSNFVNFPSLLSQLPHSSSEMKNVSTPPFWNMFNHMFIFISYVIFIPGLKWRMFQVLILSSISSGFGYGTRSVFSSSTIRGWKRISINVDRLLCLWIYFCLVFALPFLFSFCSPSISLSSIKYPCFFSTVSFTCFEYND